MVQRVRELEAATADPGMLAAAQLERLVVGDQGAGLVDAPLAREHEAGEDHGLGARPALHQATLHERDVRAAPAGGGAHATSPRRSRAAKRAVARMATAPRPSASPIQTPRPPMPSGNAATQPVVKPRTQ